MTGKTTDEILEDARRHARRKRGGADMVSRLASAISQHDPDMKGAYTLEGKEKIKQAETISEEITFGQELYDKDGVRRARLRDDGDYYILEIGIRYRDNPNEFAIERFLTICYYEVDIIKELVALMEAKNQSTPV